MLNLAGEHRRAIAAHGERAYPQEACGALLGTAAGEEKTVRATVEAANRFGDLAEFQGNAAESPANRYVIPPEDERRVIQNVFATIEKATGRRPVGWLGAGLQETWNTLDYLVEAGCRYVADWVNDDQPYLMTAGGKQLVSIPYSYDVNDKQAFEERHRTAEEFDATIRRQFDVLYREGASSGRVMAVVLHPYLTGMPYRIDALSSALDHICAHEGVWLATGEEIVNHYLASGATF